MYNNNSNSVELSVIKNQSCHYKSSDLAMTKTPFRSLRSIRSESDLQKPNSTKSELLEEIPWPRKRRSNKYNLSETGLKEWMTKTPFRSIESDLQKPNSTKSELLEEIPFSKKAKTMNNNNSNSSKLVVITNQLCHYKSSDLAMMKPPTDTFISESDLQELNPALLELADEILDRTRRSDECKLADAEKFISALRKPINSDKINCEGLSYLGKFLLLRKLNFVDENRYPDLAKVDQALRCGMSFESMTQFMEQMFILNSCPVTDEKYLFDLDVFPPACFESYVAGNPKDELVILLAKAAIDEFNKTANNPITYKFTEVVKVVSKEKTCFITFQAKDDHSGITKCFQTMAAVYCPNSVTVFYVREKLENVNSGLSVAVAGLPDSDEIK